MRYDSLGETVVQRAHSASSHIWCVLGDRTTRALAPETTTTTTTATVPIEQLPQAQQQVQHTPPHSRPQEEHQAATITTTITTVSTTRATNLPRAQQQVQQCTTKKYDHKKRTSSDNQNHNRNDDDFTATTTGKLPEAEAVCAHAMSIVEDNGAQGHKTPHLMAALLKLQSKILKRQGWRGVRFGVGVVDASLLLLFLESVDAIMLSSLSLMLSPLF